MEQAKQVAKERAAVAAVDAVVKNKMTVGVGTGSTVALALRRIAQRVRDEGLDIKCVPTSHQARQMIRDNGLPLVDMDGVQTIDVTIDSCDEFDNDLNLIGGGCGCLTQAKIVAVNSRQFVMMCDWTKMSKNLGSSWNYIPVEVIPSASASVIAKIEKRFGGRAKVRQGVAKAGPVVTDNGGFVVDWTFDRQPEEGWKIVHEYIKLMTGVVETGLFLDMCHLVFVGTENGQVKRLP